MKINQYSILKINMSNFKNNNGIYNLDVNTKYFRKLKILGKESELFRIVNHLRTYFIANNLEIEDIVDDGGKYTFIQDLLSIHINKKTKKYYENSDGIITINYINGKTETPVIYKRLLASSSHVRNQKIIYINKKFYDDALTILLCGMPKNMEFKVMAKFNSYFGLCTTDGIPVKEMPNILVIPDYEHEIEEYFDIVDEYEQDKYEVKPNQKTKKAIKPHDGGGLIDVRRVIKYCRNELNLKYIPSSLLIRCLPGFKGNVYTVDLKKYILEKGITKRVDVWGQEKELIDEDGNLLVDCILTASMVKFYDKYKSFEEWFTAFNTEVKGYKRTFNICQWSDNPKELKKTVPLSYQVLQSLQLSDEQIKSVCTKTIETITKISANVNGFIKFRGIDTKDKNKLKTMPEYYRILNTNNYLFYDPWLQKKIQEDIDGIKKRAYLGGVIVKGNYQVLGIDVVSLLQWSLNLPEITGVLEANEVYSNYWIKKGINTDYWINQNLNEIALVRFPHVSHEWKISKVVQPNHPDAKYLKYQRATICISMKDSTDIRLGGADHDNDHVISLFNLELIKATKENENKNTVLHVESWKDKKIEENEKTKKTKTKKVFRINDMGQLIKTDCAAMNSSIGKYVNKITRLWSMEQTQEIKDYIKIMSIVCSKVIDFAKTGVKAKIPEEIKLVLEHNEKLPYFMKYRYPEKVTEQNKINANLAAIGEKEEEFFTNTKCTMNKICHYLEGKIAKIKLEIPEDKFKFETMYKKKPDKYHDKYYKPILAKLKQLKKDHDTYSVGNDFLDKDEKIENANQYKLFYDYCKNALFSVCPDIDKLIDILIYAFYEDKKFYKHNPDKAILFNCFGTRLRNRLEDKAKDLSIENVENYIAQKTKSAKKGKKILLKGNIKDREVKFALYRDEKYIDLVNDDNRGLTQQEINYIKENAIWFEAKRLLYILLLLDKSCRKYKADFKLFYGAKNKTKITRKSICDLARINHKQFKKHMDEFRDKNIISLSMNSNKSYLICKVNSPIEGENEIIINDLNKSKDHFKIFKK